MNLLSPFDKILVKIDKKFQDKHKFESGVELFIDTRFNPGEYATVSGTVIAVPDRLTRIEHGSIKPIVEVGDELFFRYDCVYSWNQKSGYSEHHKNEIWHKGEETWQVQYFQAFFVKRGEQIVMIGEYVLAEDLHLETSVSNVLSATEKLQGQVKIVAGGGLEGKRAITDPKKWQKYRFWGKEYLIIKSSKILATYEP